VTDRRTDRHTDRHRVPAIAAPMHSIARQKFRRYLYSFWREPRTWQTDGQTDRHCMTAKTALMHMHRAVKSSFLRTPAFIFVCPGDAPAAITQNVAWMKRQFSACQTPRSMYPSILNSFPVIRTTSAKNRRFYVPQPTFLFPLETSLRLSRNMLHGWKDNSMLVKPLAACTYLSSIVSELYDA